MKRLTILLIIFAITSFLSSNAPAQQTPAQTPTGSAPTPSGPPNVDIGNTTPADSSSSFFIPTNTSVPADLDDVSFTPGDPASIRGAMRNVFLIAEGDNLWPDNVCTLITGETLLRQTMSLLALLTPGTDAYEALLDMQQALVSLPPATRQALPPFGSELGC